MLGGSAAFRGSVDASIFYRSFGGGAVCSDSADECDSYIGLALGDMFDLFYLISSWVFDIRRHQRAALRCHWH